MGNSTLKAWKSQDHYDLEKKIIYIIFLKIYDLSTLKKKNLYHPKIIFGPNFGPLNNILVPFNQKE